MRLCLVLLLVMCGCPKEQVAEAPQKSIGWNPSTMRCQAFDGTKFHGEFLPNEDCADQPMPKALAE